MEKIALKTVSFRTPFHMPGVGQHETFDTDIADRRCEMSYIPETSMVELRHTTGDKKTYVRWSHASNTVFMDPAPPKK